MNAFEFKPASRKQSKARVALIGPSGSGKTWTGLVLAGSLGSKVAVIDTEHGSASKYAGLLGNFDVLELQTFSPNTYVEAIQVAEKQGYDVILIDSLTHAWAGKDGALEQVDKAAARSKSGNKFTAWRDVTPMHARLIEAMIGSSCHLVVTMRSKTEWVLEEDDKGKKAPRKIGLAPVQRDGMEYEFDIVADMDLDNRLVVSKSRCPELNAAVVEKPTAELGQRILTWLEDGEPQAAPPKPVSHLRSESDPRADPAVLMEVTREIVRTQGRMGSAEAVKLCAGIVGRQVQRAADFKASEAERLLAHFRNRPSKADEDPAPGLRKKLAALCGTTAGQYWADEYVITDLNVLNAADLTTKTSVEHMSVDQLQACIDYLTSSK